MPPQLYGVFLYFTELAQHNCYHDYATGWMIHGLNPGRQTSRLALGTKQPPNQWGSFPAEKWSRHEDDHLPPNSTTVKNEQSYTSAPPVCVQNVD